MDEPPPEQPKKRKVQESAKTTWLITYAAGSPDITYEMLHSFSIKCTECHTTTWRESKYTLLHLHTSHRIRTSTLSKAMEKMRSEHNIKGSSITGYEPIASDHKTMSPLTEHPGFMRIVELMNQKSDELRSWLETGSVYTNRHSVLWNHIESRDPASMSRSQLVERVKLLTSIAEEHKTTKAAHEALHVAYMNLDRELRKRKEEGQGFFNQLCEKIAENGVLRSRLIRLGEQVE